MTRSRHLTVRLAAVTTAALLLPTTAAFAVLDDRAEPTECTNARTGETLTGEILVPANAACYLDDTTVTGHLVVDDGASLILNESTIHGPITLHNDGFIDATDSTVEGPVLATNSEAYFNTSDVNGAVMFTGAEGADRYFLTEHSTITGSTVINDAMVYASETEFSGTFTANNGQYADIIDSIVNGGLNMVGNDAGVMVCGTEVTGNTWLAENKDVTVGLKGQGFCVNPNEFSQGLLINNNTGATRLSHSTINTMLAGYDNEKKPIIGKGVDAERVYGQFVGLVPARGAKDPAPHAEEDGMMTIFGNTTADDHAQELRNRRQARRAAALEQATGR